MLKRIALLFLALLLMLPCALAEEAPEAAPAENPFVGAWEVLYYIQDGKAYTPEELGNTQMMKITVAGIISYTIDNEASPLFTYTVEDGVLVTAGTQFVLQGDDLIVGTYETGSVLLTRIDPIMLNNPFIGTWIPLCVVENGNVRDLSEWSHTAFSVFSTNTVQLIDGDYEDVYPCTYADGACTLFEEDQVYMICTISEDGLLYMADPHDSNAYQLICAKEDEVIPDEIAQFFGAWREVAQLYNNALITDQLPATMRPEDSGLLFEYDFSRATVLRTCTEITDFPSIRLLCTYADGACTVLYDDVPALCTIDENGLMCIRAEDGSWSSWLVRVEEEAPAAE